LLIANFLPLSSISGIGSIGFLTVFLIINISALKMRSRIGGKSGVFIAGIALNAFALGTLIVETIQSNYWTVIYALILVIICFIFEYFYKKSNLKIKEKTIQRKNTK